MNNVNVYPEVGLEEDTREWIEEYDHLVAHPVVDSRPMKRVVRILTDRLGPDFEHVLNKDRVVLS